ncbi:restriction endonuclease subunit S [Methanofollis aquaemaris]|uniref:Restriction endonuclease subunit S n=1 Tax=Methanofollis aquaemaris TaxID=126734 RepID=A0A8A3S3D6_9EURY|nr:restriction endonuclease subunit S [Methanofollis aquaemaris]QSZ66156.1 restriction endonuclease subunit S [Methanofollis aquaemaris]
MHPLHKDSIPQKPLKDLLNKKVTGLSSYYLKPEENDPTVEIPLINLGDLVDGIIDTETVKTTPVRKTGKLEKDTLLSGDVVLTLRGPPFRAAVGGDDVVGAALNATLVGLRCSELMRPEILAAWFNSSAGQRALTRRAGGSTLMSISLDELVQIEIPIPPMAQQDLMSKYLALTSEYSRILRREQKLQDSIVNSMMNSL